MTYVIAAYTVAFLVLILYEVRLWEERKKRSEREEHKEDRREA